MLVFCHLLVGAAVGLLFARATGDRRLVAAGLAAGLLPDLVDKPVGHLLLASTLDNGRLVAHSLGFAVALVAVALLACRRRNAALAAVFGLGVLAHQLLDAMWRDPTAWLFPLLGPFAPGHYPDYFLMDLAAELGSPSEWVFGAAAVAVILAVVRPAAAPGSAVASARRLLPVVALALGAVGAAALLGGDLVAPGLAPADLVLLGLGALGSAAVVGHEGQRRRGERGKEPG
jgi:hypothetical protein